MAENKINDAELNEVTGGAGGWQLFSVSRWNAEDGAKLRRQLETEFRAGNRTIYWDDLPMFLYPNEFTLGVRPMRAGDVIEIDTFDERRAVDPSYLSYR